jgi:dihydrodipicolinate synthase/N-acetylneuraminate lyase
MMPVIDESLAALVEDAIVAGVHGFVTPAVASEAEYLDVEERHRIVRIVAATTGERVPWILGASSSDAQVSVPQALTAYIKCRRVRRVLRISINRTEPVFC